MCYLEKSRRDTFLNRVKEIDRKFRHVKILLNENKVKQTSRYRFPKHETIDQLENVFVFDLETYNDQEIAEAYSAGLHVVNPLRHKWDRNLTGQERKTERENKIYFNGSDGNPVMDMLK